MIFDGKESLLKSGDIVSFSKIDSSILVSFTRDAVFMHFKHGDNKLILCEDEAPLHFISHQVVWMIADILNLKYKLLQEKEKRLISYQLV